MLKDLEIEEESAYSTTLTQAGFDDAWTYIAKWDGCLNFAQYRSREDNVIEQGTMEHACNVQLLIDHLTQVQDFARAKWGKIGVSDGKHASNRLQKIHPRCA